MSSSLAGKVVLITGGSKGIGAATSLLFAKSGAKVAINYSSDSSAADDIVKKIGSDQAVAIKADAGRLTDIELMVAETVKRFGKIDIVVPNAGILPMKGVEDTTEEDFDKTMQVNVKGPYFLVQVCSLPSIHITQDPFLLSCRKHYPTCPRARTLFYSPRLNATRPLSLPTTCFIIPAKAPSSKWYAS